MQRARDNKDDMQNEDMTRKENMRQARYNYIRCRIYVKAYKQDCQGFNNDPALVYSLNI